MDKVGHGQEQEQEYLEMSIEWALIAGAWPRAWTGAWTKHEQGIYRRMD
jgi:hypothetical protein